MPRHDIDELRSHLFGTLAQLRDKDNPMDLDRARTVAQVAKAVIDSARAENEFLRATGEKGSPFFSGEESDVPRIERAPGDKPGITGVTRHRLK